MSGGAAQHRRPAVFLDRDGTLHEERDFCRRREDVAVFPGVGTALAALRHAGYALVVLTNQSGIARGYFSESDLARIHDEVQLQADGQIDAFLHCPHLPGEGAGPYTGHCTCRKPAQGLSMRAVELLDLEWHGSFVVGDSARDLLAVPPAVRGILVRSGKPFEPELAALTRAGRAPEAVVDGLVQAVAVILDVATRG